ncbi:MAG: alanine racemase [Clostridia bacterium]|nr:alanine racemase [Clostridia bacterium]
MQKVIARVNLKAIKENAAAFKELTKTKLCAVVKADAYGHGAERVVCALEAEADMFAVALLSEGLAIRTAACGKPILVLTPPVTATEARAIVQSGLIATVPDLFTARLMANAATDLKRSVSVHLKVNTGMNRYGMNASMLGRVCTFLKREQFVLVEGLYSHLYTQELAESQNQLRLFLRMKAVAARYYPVLCCHLSATYGALLGKAFALDMVRVGLGLYGYLPIGKEAGISALPPLKKAMTVLAYAVSTRKYSFGGAGYDSAEMRQPERGEQITALRVGYADGFLRDGKRSGALDKKGLNNLCMDVALMRGKKERGALVPVLSDANESAAREGTISYEVLCAATRRAEFVYEYE